MLVSLQTPMDAAADASTLNAVTTAEDAWKALAQANDWIKVADTKAGAVIAASGVLGGFLLRAVPAPGHWGQDPWKVGILLVALAVVGTSALMSLRVFTPRLRTGEAPSLLYFDHIARCYPRPEEFTGPYLAMLRQEERLQESLAEQLWATSVIARRKFRSVTYAIWLLGAGIALAVAAGFLPI